MSAFRMAGRMGLWALASMPVTHLSAQASPGLEGLSFLLGEWEASGAGEPGLSGGVFSFQWAAGSHALLRRNEAVTPGGVHTDIMLVYEQPGSPIRAVYADNEGNVIEYEVSVAVAGGRAVFESGGAGPRFRLWYEALEDGALATGFEIAQPGSSEFKTYLEGVAHRRRTEALDQRSQDLQVGW